MQQARSRAALAMTLAAAMALAATAAAADTDSTTQEVDATVESSITISTNSAFTPVSFGTLAVGDNAVDGGVLTVESSEDYQLLVQGNNDFMTNADATETLGNPLRVGEAGSLGLSEVQITTTEEVFADTTGLSVDLTTATDYDLELRQQHESTDAIDTYTMTVTWTATTNI